MDETRAPVLDPGRGRTKSGFLWALARDDRGWNGPEGEGSMLSLPGTLRDVPESDSHRFAIGTG